MSILICSFARVRTIRKTGPLFPSSLAHTLKKEKRNSTLSPYIEYSSLVYPSKKKLNTSLSMKEMAG